MVLILKSQRSKLNELWHYTKFGSFSVKSAYHLACHNDRHSNPSSSHSNSPYFRIGWMSIWNAKIPNKIKVFAWRLCNDALSVGSNVRRRLPFSDICCPFCYEQDDNSRHTFFLCPFSRIVWCISHLRSSVISNWQTNARDWVFHAHEQLEATKFDLFLIICWSILWCRNKKWSEGIPHKPDQVVSFARGYLDSFTEITVPIPSFNTTIVFALWRPPENSFVKVNYDVALFLDTGREHEMGTPASEILEGSPSMPPKTKFSNLSVPGGTKSKEGSENRKSGSKLPLPL
ncbi:hypothetical protein Sango_0022700 [Sesamum angolense]|uniref:Reverse transcriptase zinc-binding domain-containing protein n=1 Tax=Sesamum angolense TaxID=2727404 RepID=A0AAE1XDL6_9LAMI|nr:hypothetical protein Sango_0022700 [Sesamum angolense]